MILAGTSTGKVECCWLSDQRNAIWTVMASSSRGADVVGAAAVVVVLSAGASHRDKTCVQDLRSSKIPSWLTRTN
jgi:hypothetical protein